MPSPHELIRVAVVADPSRVSASHARLLDALSQSTLAGFRLDLPGADLPADGAHDLIHLLGPAPAPASRALARERAIPVVGAYPAVLGHLGVTDCARILSPGAAADAELIAAGAVAGQLMRWQPGVDPESFGPGHYRADTFARVDGRVNVLHVGPPEVPELLAAAFGAAATLEPRLQLVGAEADADLPRLYASADLLVDVSDSADFPLSILEAQASGLPVLALDRGGAGELIEDGRTGVLVPPTPRALAEALISLSRRAALRERLTVGGLGATRSRTWSRSLGQLTDAWTAALAPADARLLSAA